MTLQKARDHMKIGPLSNPNFLSGYQVNRSVPGRSTSAPGKVDEASFSEEAISFSKLFTELKDTVDARSDEELQRIAELRGQVRGGTYHVDSEDIAESIIADFIG